MATKRPVETPGAAAVEAGVIPGVPADWEPSDDDTPQVAALKAQLKAQAEQLAGATKLPQVVYEPTTPKGAEAIAASPYYAKGITSKELMRQIDAGEVREPLSSVLCADGYYAPRNR
jgi:hypothetical protein